MYKVAGLCNTPGHLVECFLFARALGSSRHRPSCRRRFFRAAKTIKSQTKKHFQAGLAGSGLSQFCGRFGPPKAPKLGSKMDTQIGVPLKKTYIGTQKRGSFLDPRICTARAPPSSQHGGTAFFFICFSCQFVRASSYYESYVFGPPTAFRTPPPIACHGLAAKRADLLVDFWV